MKECTNYIIQIEFDLTYEVLKENNFKDTKKIQSFSEVKVLSKYNSADP